MRRQQQYTTRKNNEEISNKAVFTLLSITVLVSVLGFFLVIGSLEDVGQQAQVVSGQRSGVVQLTIDSPPVPHPVQEGTGRVVLNIVNETNSLR